MVLSEGTKLGPYEIRSVLGTGAMGEVYRAWDPKLGREIAIKVLRHEVAAERIRRAEKEARAASALNHPNIVTIHDVGFEGPVPYIAMELIQGETLRTALSRGALPVRKMLLLASQLADGLAKAHGAGIVHRDLKPDNLMVSEDGFIKILDFGLATLAPERNVLSSEAATLTKETGGLVGTVAYMSPEQAKGQAVDHRSDQFALGVVLHEIATGHHPFLRETAAQTLTAIMEDEAEPLSGAAPHLPERFRHVGDAHVIELD